MWVQKDIALARYYMSCCMVCRHVMLSYRHPAKPCRHPSTFRFRNVDTRHHLDVRHNRSLILLLATLHPLGRSATHSSAFFQIRLGSSIAHSLVEHSCPMPALYRRLLHHRIGRGQFCVFFGQGLVCAAKTAADSVDAFSGQAVKRMEDGNASGDCDDCRFYKRP